MISLNIEKTFGFISKEKVSAYEAEVKAAQEMLEKGTGKGNDFLGWLHLPSSISKEHLADLNATAKVLRDNCEVANMDKIAVAASEQLKDIMLLKEKKMFQKLPANLKQIANLRVKYPEASLDKIGDMLDVKLSRSGVSHRFKKIKEIANEVRDK